MQRLENIAPRIENTIFGYEVEAFDEAKMSRLLQEKKLNEAREGLAVELKKFNRVYTAETIKEAKKDRAYLNKLYNAINDVKKAEKKRVLASYNDFEAFCKALMADVEKASDTIDEQVKEYERSQREARYKALEAYYEGKGLTIPFSQFGEEAWLKASTSEANAKTAIDSKVDYIKSNLSVIESFGGEKAEYVRLEYLESLDLPRAIRSYDDYMARKEAVEKARKTKENVAVEAPKEKAKRFDCTYTFIASEDELVTINKTLKAMGVAFMVLKKEEI